MTLAPAIRILNGLTAALFGMAAFGLLIFAPEQWARYGEEPEDFQLLIFWAIICAALAILCGINSRARFSPSQASGKILLGANAFSAIALMTLAYVARDDVATVYTLLVLAAAPFVTAVTKTVAASSQSAQSVISERKLRGEK